MGTGAPARLVRQLSGCRDTDEVAVATLRALTGLAGVVRAGLALTVVGGRQLRFLSSDAERLGPTPDWCLIDTFDHLPLNDAVRTGRQVVLGTTDAVRRVYPDLPTTQAGSPTSTVVAVPICVGDDRLGGLLAYSTIEHHRELVETVSRMADVVATTLYAVRRSEQTSAETLPTAGLLLPADATAPGLARRSLQRVLSDLDLDGETVAAALVCASELVTNVVMHTGRPSVMSVERSEDALLVRIEQPTGTRTARIATVPDRDPLRISGRGLQLVEALASAWGSEASTASTSTWYRLDL